MSGKVKVTRRKSGLASLGKRQRQETLRVWAGTVGRGVHRVTKPNKFKRSAASRYGHLPRSRRYNLAKAARYKHPTAGRASGEVLDFVWRGTSRALLMGRDKVNVTARSSSEARADVIFHAPIFNASKLEDGTSLRDEFVRKNAAEVRYLYGLGKRAHDRAVRRLSRPRTTTKAA